MATCQENIKKTGHLKVTMLNKECCSSLCNVRCKRSNRESDRCRSIYTASEAKLMKPDHIIVKVVAAVLGPGSENRQDQSRVMNTHFGDTICNLLAYTNTRD